MKVLVTGASGLLGGDVAEKLSSQYEVVPVKGRQDLEVTDVKAVFELFAKEKPDAVVHAAAWRDIDKSETEPRDAYKVNCLGTRHIVQAAASTGSKVVYISSDAVFDGKKGKPYVEFDEPNPLHVYGRTKLAGEEITRALTPKHFIIRIPLLFGHSGKRERNNILGLVDKAKKSAGIVATIDQIAGPTYTYHIADVIGDLLGSEYYGTYHVSNHGAVSRYGFAQRVLELLGIDVSCLRGVPYLESGKPAPRQHYVTLDTLAVETTLGKSMPTWEEALRECLEEMKKRGEL